MITLEIVCPFCGEVHFVDVLESELEAYENGALAGATLIKKDKDQKSQCSTANSFDEILRKKIKILQKSVDKQKKK